MEVPPARKMRHEWYELVAKASAPGSALRAAAESLRWGTPWEIEIQRAGLD